MLGIYGRQAEALTRVTEEQAWDGAWYRRAYYDDGTPLGSRGGQEARIDSVAQSWAVISGAADPGRAAQALQAAEHTSHPLGGLGRRAVLAAIQPDNE